MAQSVIIVACIVGTDVDHLRLSSIHPDPVEIAVAVNQKATARVPIRRFDQLVRLVNDTSVARRQIIDF